MRSRRRFSAGWAAILSVWLTGCCCPAPPPAVEATPAAATPMPLPVPEQVANAPVDTAVQMLIRNVRLHLAHGVVLRIDEMRGEMHSVGGPAQPPVLSDPTSYVIHIDSAEVGMDMPSMERLMNRIVFAYDGAPLRNLRLEAVGNRLRMHGIMHKGVALPFTITSSVSLTPEGLIRIHPEEIRICGVDGGGFLRALGITLQDMLDLSRARGVRVEQNDLLLDATMVLPPPRIAGRLTSIRMANGVLMQTMRGDARSDRPLVLPDSTIPNFLFFQRSTLRFGKLYMVRADLMIVDADPADPFEFSGLNFDPQLVAGYSRTLEDHGLMAIVPDLTDLPTTVPVPRVVR